jgi:hypothetical protein
MRQTSRATRLLTAAVAAFVAGAVALGACGSGSSGAGVLLADASDATTDTGYPYCLVGQSFVYPQDGSPSCGTWCCPGLTTAITFGDGSDFGMCRAEDAPNCDPDGSIEPADADVACFAQVRAACSEQLAACQRDCDCRSYATSAFHCFQGVPVASCFVALGDVLTELFGDWTFVDRALSQCVVDKSDGGLAACNPPSDAASPDSSDDARDAAAE